MIESIDNEQWLPVVGYEGLYQVSNLGRVGSVHHIVQRSNGHPFTVAERLLSPSTNKQTGYKVVSLRAPGASTSFHVHTLVLTAFAGPCPAGFECCYNNGDRSDSRLDNLRWDAVKTHKDDMRAHGTMILGEDASWSVLTEEQVLEIRKRYVPYVVTQRELAYEFGVSSTHVGKIVREETWQHI